MIKINNITNNPDQSHNLLFLDDNVSIRFRFLEVVTSWVVDVSYKDRDFKGITAVVGAPLLPSANLPFDVIIIDESGSGLDPVSVDDLKDRMSIYVSEPEDMKIIRGYSVEL